MISNYEATLHNTLITNSFLFPCEILILAGMVFSRKKYKISGNLSIMYSFHSNFFNLSHFYQVSFCQWLKYTDTLIKVF